MKRLLIIQAVLALAISLLLAGCSGGGDSKAQCEKDGDCPANWRCDAYAMICRCINDNACNVGGGERCMPNGTCQLYTGCSSDPECGSCQRCEVSTGECLCTGDCACAEGEFCNSSGFCQPSTGCFDNDDCATGEFCDTSAKSCIPTNTCTNKYQCPFGQICAGGTCVSGCEDHGDCPFHQACINGVCTQGVCPDDSFCDFMEYCSAGTCLSAYNDQYAPYCKPCQNEDLNGCGDPLNPCLIYEYFGDAFEQNYPFPRLLPNDPAEYCAVDCSGGQRCPVGFYCATIISIKQSDICQNDWDCPAGLPCLKGESDTGFCPCHDINNPCPDNSCVAFFNMCAATGLPCSTDADCYNIVCEKYDPQDYGGCVSAKGCGLEEGFHCPWPPP